MRRKIFDAIYVPNEFFKCFDENFFILKFHELDKIILYFVKDKKVYKVIDNAKNIIKYYKYIKEKKVPETAINEVTIEDVRRISKRIERYVEYVTDKELLEKAKRILSVSKLLMIST